MNILICTIIRNREPFLDGYHKRICEITKLFPHITFTLSIYENDSVDNSADTLQKFTWPIPTTIKSEKLGTKFYFSVKDEDRVNRLAEARNKCLEQADLTTVDKVLWIEPDAQYDPKELKLLLDVEADVISGRSVCPGCNLYDTWATRPNKEATEWQGAIPEGYRDVYTTFNCVCLYNAKPFQQGIRFSGYNDRLQAWDCDTVVIVEKFREAGYNKVILASDFVIIHN